MKWTTENGGKSHILMGDQGELARLVVEERPKNPVNKVCVRTLLSFMCVGKREMKHLEATNRVWQRTDKKFKGLAEASSYVEAKKTQLQHQLRSQLVPATP